MPRDPTQAILDTVLDCIITIDEQGIVQSANRAVQRILGYEPQELIGNNVKMLVPEPMASEHDTYLANYLEGRKGRVIGIGREVEGLHKDGRSVPLHLGVSEAELGGKRIFVGVLHDLTALRRAETQRDRFVELTPDLMCTLGDDGRVQTFNRAWLQGLGYQRTEVMGADFASFVHVEDAEATKQVLARLEPGAQPQELEHRIRCRDGSYRWMEWLFMRTAESVTYAAARDVSTRQEVDRLKSEFVSTVSHELRTPLTSIRGSLGLLESQSAMPDDKRADLLRIARENTDRLIRLINDVLDLERIESGRLELRPTLVRLEDVVRASVQSVEGLARDVGAQIQVDCPRELRIRADHDRLVQVLVNLLGNALKFSPRGGRVAVRVDAGDGSKTVRIAVEDEGPGIPHQSLARMFDKFEQLDASDKRAKGGTGLGLAIARAIVQQHGGEIGAVSEQGKGSEFYFTLPLLENTWNSEAKAAHVGLESVESAQHVMIVEDSEDLGRVLRTILQAEGYCVSVANSVAGAKALLGAIDVDVVLLDIGLPDGSGTDLWQWMQQHGKQTPVVVISGRGAADQGGGPGGPALVDWLSKPFSNKQLLFAIRRAVHGTAATPAVLIVEDDDATRRVIAEQVKVIGARCFEASNGAEAVELSQSEPPDLIVLDIGMCGMDGFELVQRLRQRKERTASLIVYTNRDLSGEQRKRLKLGMTKYLTKARSTEKQFVHAMKDLLDGLLPGEPQMP